MQHSGCWAEQGNISPCWPPHKQGHPKPPAQRSCPKGWRCPLAATPAALPGEGRAPGLAQLHPDPAHPPAPGVRKPRVTHLGRTSGGRVRLAGCGAAGHGRCPVPPTPPQARPPPSRAAVPGAAAPPSGLRARRSHGPEAPPAAPGTRAADPTARRVLNSSAVHRQLAGQARARGAEEQANSPGHSWAGCGGSRGGHGGEAAGTALPAPPPGWGARPPPLHRGAWRAAADAAKPEILRSAKKQAPAVSHAWCSRNDRCYSWAWKSPLKRTLLKCLIGLSSWLGIYSGIYYILLYFLHFLMEMQELSWTRKASIWFDLS